jgi:hypothetical protein
MCSPSAGELSTCLPRDAKQKPLFASFLVIRMAITVLTAKHDASARLAYQILPIILCWLSA